jgi:hypothetical protein
VKGKYHSSIWWCLLFPFLTQDSGFFILYPSLLPSRSHSGLVHFNEQFFSSMVVSEEGFEVSRNITPLRVVKYLTREQRTDTIEELKVEMKTAAKYLEFERAAQLRHEVNRLTAMET